MELHEFITESLKQISGSVHEAQLGNHFIAPEGTRLNVDKQIGVIGPYGKPLYMVDFDVAVTASKSNKVTSEAKGGIITVISGGVNAAIEHSHQHITRIRFSVPIVFNEPNT